MNSEESETPQSNPHGRPAGDSGPYLSPHEELEAQITALLLGELPEPDANALRQRIAADPALVQLHARLGLTIGLVKEAIASPEPAELAAPEGLKLSDDKREQLLAAFKTPQGRAALPVPQTRRSSARRERKKTIQVDFRTWGALAAMLTALLSILSWMTGGRFISRTVEQARANFGYKENGQYDRSPGRPSVVGRVEPGAERALAELSDTLSSARERESAASNMMPPPVAEQTIQKAKVESLRAGKPAAVAPAAPALTPPPAAPQNGPGTRGDERGRGLDLFLDAAAVADDKTKSAKTDALGIVLPKLENGKLSELAQNDSEAKNYFFATPTDPNNRGFAVNGAGAANTWGVNLPPGETPSANGGVYSVNAVGYVNVDANALKDINLVANPLQIASESNRFIGRYAYQSGGFGGGGGASFGRPEGPGGFFTFGGTAGDNAAVSQPSSATGVSNLGVAEPKLDFVAPDTFRLSDREGKKDSKLPEPEWAGVLEKPAAAGAELQLQRENRGEPGKLAFANSDSDSDKVKALFDAPKQITATRELDRLGRAGTSVGQPADQSNLGFMATATGGAAIDPVTGLPAQAPAIVSNGADNSGGRKAGREMQVALGDRLAEGRDKEVAEVLREQESLAKKVPPAKRSETGEKRQRVFVANVENGNPEEIGQVLRNTFDRNDNSNAATARGNLPRSLAAAAPNTSLDVSGGLTLSPQTPSRSLQSASINRAAPGESASRMPAQYTERSETSKERIAASQKVQDARLMIENGRLEEAEKNLKQALTEDPEHRAAQYYLDLIKEQKYQREARNREVAVKDGLVNIEKSWRVPVTREKLPEAAAKATTANTPATAEATTAEESTKWQSIGLPAEKVVARLTRDLETEEKIRDSIVTRIDQETVDQKIPKSGLVDVVERAEADSAKSPSLMERFRGTKRVARIEVNQDVTDVSPLMQNSQTGNNYDPYFLQTEFEKIKSQSVLDRVIQKLDLTHAWADKNGGAPLTTNQAYALLKKMVDVEQNTSTPLIDVGVRADKPAEAARIANTIVDAYKEIRSEQKNAASMRGVQALQDELQKENKKIEEKKAELEKLKKERGIEDKLVTPKSSANAAIPQPEVAVSENALSTFSLNVSDVSFKLAAASLEKGVLPDAASIRSEEFVNAFDYRDPAAVGSAPVAFAWERARDPFGHDRDLLRFSVKTGASGREAGHPLNLVLLLDNSGSMERADRVRIIQECLRVLAAQLQPQDKVSVVTFARTAQLRVDGLAGNQAGDLPARVGEFTPEGGTNLEEAMRVAYETAAKHFQANGVNRVVLLTDGAANLGNVEPESLKKNVETHRKQGVALDCFGIGWEGFNDDLLEQLSRNGDGRYGFVNSPEEAGGNFATQLAGALHVAASDVKVQVEFNPKRTTIYRQVGYAKHQLTKEQFRDNTVDAAELGAAEAGNAIYVVQTNPAGEGPIATVRVRFKVPGTTDYREHEWPVPYEGAARPLEESSPALRLAATAAEFSEWLAANPYAAEVTPDRLLQLIANVPEAFPNDPRPKQLEWMIRQAKSIAGK